jgi:hypothetical protein
MTAMEIGRVLDVDVAVANILAISDCNEGVGN